MTTEDQGNENDDVYFGPLVRAREDGTYRVEFPENIRQLLIWLADQLDVILDHDSPELTRLFPTAYADDPERDAGYQILARGQLVDYRREAITVLRDTAEESVLGEDQLSAWMRVVNDLRLVIGTRLDVSEDDDYFTPEQDKDHHESGEDGLAEDDPDAGLIEIYHVLGIVLSHIVDALTGTLPVILDEPTN